MKPFIHEDFLLTNDVGRKLFHATAESAPIYDFHCHLDARALAADLPYPNLTSLWIANDPYKHRAMRLTGVPERLITGDATDQEKFAAWAATLPQTLGNPLFEWSALELSRSFGVAELLNPSNQHAIWIALNRSLSEPARSPRGLLRSTRCAVICTSDNLLDDLTAHAELARSSFEIRVLPSLRADDLLEVGEPYLVHGIERLEQAAGFRVRTVEDWTQAVQQRLDVFSALGCRLADHGIDEFAYVSASDESLAQLFGNALRGSLQPQEKVALQSGLLRRLAQEYATRGWAMQLHLGAQRRTSARLLRTVGKAGGFATIGASVDIAQLCNFFDDLERTGSLPRTIVYPLNPVDYASIATLTGSFTGDGVRGHLQLGPAWWYNDHAFGMRQQLDLLSSYGLLSTFVGMTTDSRSPLSMHRHEYFRRVLCDWMGSKVAAGHFPEDEALLATYVRNICGNNARSWPHLEDDDDIKP